ncbi:N-acetylmuramoyl-L-alanine amidase [Kitasatospora sp. McL0602]|uniref:N-acetylmuramoyl-L-alanine amidase n=1 Tax=Kitasatospora sp. McL0602 TaxID=3439530 RepID=UPI003F8AD113
MTSIQGAAPTSDPNHAVPGSTDRRSTHRRKNRLRLPLAVTAAIAASATGFALLSTAATTPAAAAAGSDALQRQFAAAAGEFHVPASVLLALSYQQTRWESHQGSPSTTGNYNVMGLTQVDVASLTSSGAETDGRGDGTPAKAAPAPVTTPDSPAFHTLDAAAKLIGKPADQLRTDTAQSVRGGAALLAKYQKAAGKSLSATPGDWYDALVAFSQYDAASGGSAFADRVLGTIRSGEARTTADGQTVTLAADSSVVDRPQLSSRAVAPGNVECPPTLGCEAKPASSDNYSTANRPADQDAIQYIVIHDTEGSYDGAVKTFQTSGNTSAHYIVRSGDGHVAQLVNTKDVAWHAGNKTFNMHSIGIEHEGYAIGSDSKGNPTWYSEQLYQSSATLTRYLAGRFDIPLDRQHIIGHDDVPKPTELDSAGKPISMHWDPGTFWDWSHYMDLLGAPIRANIGGSLLVGGKVTIAPAFDSTNQPPVDGVSGRPENFVYLRTSPDNNAPLINGGQTYASDVRAKAVAGASYVVADQQGDWTAIWYDGVKGWFYNPNGQSAAADNRQNQTVLTPRAGASSIPVYGRSYPEVAAYGKYPGVYDPALHNPIPLNSTVPAGQRYVAASDSPVAGDLYYDGNPQVLVIGNDKYYPIRYGHRLAFLKSTDVDVVTAVTPAPSGYTPFGPARVMDTRYGIGTGIHQAKVGADSTITLPVAGAGTGVPSDATSVILNVTAVSPSAGSFVTVYPNGQPRPLASNLNFTAGQTIPNLVVVPVVNGKVNFYNKFGAVDLIADITGYYTPGGASKFTTTTPTRLLDTRLGQGAPKAKVGADSRVTLQVSGNAGVPADATGVVLNVTATGPTAGSFVTVYPNGANMPTVSNLNFSAGQTIPNLVIVPITNGKVDLYNKFGAVDLVADITGYYTPGGASKFTSAGPSRLLDTRLGVGAAKAKVGPGSNVALQVSGRAGLPTSGVKAVVLNVTAVAPTAGGFVTVYPDGTSLPTASNLNFTAGQVIPNLVVVPVGANGKVDLYNKFGAVDLVADITGYYTG